MTAPYTSSPDVDQLRQERAVVDSPPLSLDIPDGDLLAVIDQKVRDAKRYFDSEVKLAERGKRNTDYWKGKQHENGTYHQFQRLPGFGQPYTHNVLYRDLETRIAIAAGRMPDIIVVPDKPGDTGSEKDAKDYEQYLNGIVNGDMGKRLIKSVLRDHQLKLTGVLKARWDPNRGPLGNVAFDRVKVESVEFDHTATIPEDGYTSDNMEFISEWLEEPLSLVAAKFPAKAADLLAMFRVADASKASAKAMASKVRYRETWATWYDRDGKRSEIVVWHYKTLVLQKMKSPYWDWEEDGRNHFDMPRKPYMFASYGNTGGPVDDTTSFEQAVALQDVVNKRGIQISDINDRSVPKLAIAGTAMTKEEAEALTPDPNENLYLNKNAGNDASKAVQVIAAPAAGPGLYADQQQAVNAIDAMMATHSITRGESGSDDMSGVAKQITREGDLSIADDVVQVIVQRLVSEMANWATQLIVMHYVDPNKGKKPADSGYDWTFPGWTLKQPKGDGQYSQVTMTADRVRKGVMVTINASTVDKPTHRSLVMQLSQEKGIDLYSLYEGLDLPNPKELTKRMVLFMNGGGPTGDGYAGYLKELGIDMPATERTAPQPNAQGQTDLQGEPATGTQDSQTQDDQQQAVNAIQTVEQGQVPSTPQVPSSTYVATITAYVQSSRFNQLPDDAKQALVKYVDELHRTVGQLAQPQAPAVQ